MGEFNLDWFCTDIKIKRTPEVLSLSDRPGIKHHELCAQLYDFFLFTFSPIEPMTTVCKVGLRFTVLRYFGHHCRNDCTRLWHVIYKRYLLTGKPIENAICYLILS